MKESKNTIIWFQHFHKAGGSSLITAARYAGKTFHDPNSNGNPLDENGEVLPIWEWGEEVLEDWLKNLSRQEMDLINGKRLDGNGEGLPTWALGGQKLTAWLRNSLMHRTNFIACEWGYSHAVLEFDPNLVETVTILRHPIERLVSNFFFDAAEGHTIDNDIMAYMETPEPYTKPDYYTRLITGDSGLEATRCSLASLRKFAHVGCLGHPKTFESIESLIPGVLSYHSNKTTQSHAKLETLRKNVEKNAAYIEDIAVYELALYEALLEGRDQLSI